jgi:lysozyme family protein
MRVAVRELIEKVIGVEGGYSNHPADRGGPTKWGITEQVARAYGYNGDMRNFPRELAITIYEKIYWIRPGFDRIATAYPAVAEELFDIGVNMGPGTGAKFLQRALNVLNRGGTGYPDIKVDGDVGPGTLAALKGYRAQRGSAGEIVLLRLIDAQQAVRYIEITEARPANEAFMYGWVANRVGLHA